MIIANLVINGRPVKLLEVFAQRHLDHAGAPAKNVDLIATVNVNHGQEQFELSFQNDGGESEYQLGHEAELSATATYTRLLGALGAKFNEDDRLDTVLSGLNGFEALRIAVLSTAVKSAAA